jgi:hypothetical protein
MIGLVAGVVNGNQSDSSAELSCFKDHGGAGVSAEPPGVIWSCSLGASRG